MEPTACGRARLLGDGQVMSLIHQAHPGTDLFALAAGDQMLAQFEAHGLVGDFTGLDYILRQNIDVIDARRRHAKAAEFLQLVWELSLLVRSRYVFFGLIIELHTVPARCDK